MSREKQIEEKNCKECLHFEACSKWTDFPRQLGFPTCRHYRKQSEGEWEQQLRPYEDEIKCTACGAIFNIIDNCTEKFNHCPNCGAKMKGGEE